MATGASRDFVEQLALAVADEARFDSGENSKALCQVIDLHTYARTKGTALRDRCSECGFAFPCPTLEAIAKAINYV